MDRLEARAPWRSLQETFRQLRTHNLAVDRLQYIGEFNLHAYERRTMMVGLVVEKAISAESFARVESLVNDFEVAAQAVN